MWSSLKVRRTLFCDLHGTFGTFSERLGDHVLFGNVMFPERSQNVPTGVKHVAQSGTFGDGHDVEFFKGSEDVILRPSRNIRDVLRTSPLVSNTLPSNVSGTFGDGHDVEFFKGSEDVILRPSQNIRDVLRTFRGPMFYLDM